MSSTRCEKYPTTRPIASGYVTSDCQVVNGVKNNNAARASNAIGVWKNPRWDDTDVATPEIRRVKTENVEIDDFG